MSNNITIDEVVVGPSQDPERPIALRFGPHLDDHGKPCDEWTVERLTRSQAWALLANLENELTRTMNTPPTAVIMAEG